MANRTLTAAVVPVTATSAVTSTATSTPTSTLTSTPTMTITAAAMTGGPRLFTDDFGRQRNKELIWQITPYSSGVLREIANGFYHIRSASARMAATALFDQANQYAENFQYEADFTVSKESQSDTGTGIVFRYLNQDNYYVFGINGQGQISIWSRLKGVWKELREGSVNWTPTEAAKPKGQVNRLRLADFGNQLQGFVNDTLVIDLSYSPQVAAGSIGVYLGTTSTNTSQPLADIIVDNWTVSEAFSPVTPTPTVESMTGPTATNTKKPIKNTKPPATKKPAGTALPDLGGGSTSSTGGGSGGAASTTGNTTGTTTSSNTTSSTTGDTTGSTTGGTVGNSVGNAVGDVVGGVTSTVGGVVGGLTGGGGILP
jgi:hypothetical protein